MAVTITEKTYTSMKLIIFDWTSDASGDATGTTTNSYDGGIYGFATDPDGTAIPTDNYNITITDLNSIDVLFNSGLLRDTANIEYVAEASLGAVSGSTLTFTVADAGATKKGKAYLYIR